MRPTEPITSTANCERMIPLLGMNTRTHATNGQGYKVSYPFLCNLEEVQYSGEEEQNNKNDSCREWWVVAVENKVRCAVNVMISCHDARGELPSPDSRCEVDCSIANGPKYKCPGTSSTHTGVHSGRYTPDFMMFCPQ